MATFPRCSALPAIPELEPVTDHSDVSTISKQPPRTLTKPMKVTKSELCNCLTPPLSDHCYWSDQTSSIREEEESPASATSLEVTPSPRPESKIDAREDSLEPLSILFPQTLKNQGQEVLHHGVCWEQGGEEDGEQWTENITRGCDRTVLSRMIPAPYIYPHMALTSSIRWSNW